MVGSSLFFLCGEQPKNKQGKGHKVMVQQNTIVSISKGAINSSMSQLIQNKCFASLEADPTAGHTAQEDGKAAPASAMPQAVPKPTWANGCKRGAQENRGV